MFQVLDNDRPADNKHIALSGAACWSRSAYDTFEEAREYARNWLGSVYGDLADSLTINKPLGYSGYGDTIEIREV